MGKEDIDKALAAQRQARGYQAPKRGKDKVEATKPEIWWRWRWLRASEDESVRLTSRPNPKRPTEKQALDNLS